MANVFDLSRELPTPALVVSGAAVRANIATMQSYCNEKGLKLAPHTKTHKSRLVGGLQVEAGATALTVAKGGEAEIMGEVSSEVFVAYPPIGKARLGKVTELAKNKRVRVGIDSLEAAEYVSAGVEKAGVQIGVLVDLDVGFHRTGVRGIDDALQLATAIEKLPGLALRGVMCFPGNVGSTATDPQWQIYKDQLGTFLERWNQLGLPTPIVSGGSTPTAKLSHLNPWLTEIRPGTYVYNDVNELKLGVATLDQCAARVCCTVVSRPTSAKCIVDAGSKTLSSDRCGPAPDSGFGLVIEHPEAKISRLSEEYGEIEFPDGQVAPSVGTRLMIVPNHICVCVNLQNSFYWIEGSDVMQKPVDARGLLV
jgi:D-serine deaminase-like pyridoxal phosphate-dependent protein